MERHRRRAARWLTRPSNGLGLLAASLLAWDHRWTGLTWGGLSLLAGAMMIRKADA